MHHHVDEFKSVRAHYRPSPEDLLTTKFIKSRGELDEGDTLPFALEEMDLVESAPYDRFEIEQEVVIDSEPVPRISLPAVSILASSNLVLDTVEIVKLDRAETETVEPLQAPAPAPSSRALMPIVSIVLLAAAFGLGLGLAFLAF
jgi:hypothetical protein